MHRLPVIMPVLCFLIFIMVTRRWLGVAAVVQAVVLLPVNGHWSAWASWSKCTVTCGDGKKLRRRVCDNPEPANGGKDCKGHTVETRTCMLADCPSECLIGSLCFHL